VGSTVFTGTLAAGTTVLVAALTAGVLEPLEFAATTDTVSVFPMLPTTGT
jgi:hypothetical protein